MFTKNQINPQKFKSWCIFSDNLRYVQHNQLTSQDLDIDALDYCDHKDVYFPNEEMKKEETLDVDFGLYPDITKS